MDLNLLVGEIVKNNGLTGVFICALLFAVYKLNQDLTTLRGELLTLIKAYSEVVGDNTKALEAVVDNNKLQQNLVNIFLESLKK